MFKITSANHALFILKQLRIVIKDYLEAKGWRIEGDIHWTKDSHAYFTEAGALSEQIEIENGKQ